MKNQSIISIFLSILIIIITVIFNYLTHQLLTHEYEIFIVGTGGVRIVLFSFAILSLILSAISIKKKQMYSLLAILLALIACTSIFPWYILAVELFPPSKTL